MPTSTTTAKARRILAARLRSTRPIRGPISGNLFHKFVPHADHRLNVPGTARIGLDLSPQVLYVAINRTLVPFEGLSLNRVQKLHAREDTAGLLRQGGENLKLGPG